MNQPLRIAVMAPLAVGAIAFAATILIRALAILATLGLVRHQVRRAGAAAGFWTDFRIVAEALSVALAAHLLDIACWAVVIVSCGQFSDLGVAYYHSAMNYTTLGYGDLVMAPAWRMLGPLEAANGMLMFGVSTAIIFAVIQRLIRAKFIELRD